MGGLAPALLALTTSSSMLVGLVFCYPNVSLFVRRGENDPSCLNVTGLYSQRSCSACLRISPGKSVAICKGSMHKAAKVSSLIPDFR